MQFSIIIITIIALNIAATSSAVAIGFYKNPEHPGKCVLKDLGLILSPGEKVPQKAYCGIINCGANGIVTSFSCGILVAPDGCKIKEPLNREAIYPDCCPSEIICNHISRS